jgi:hypothetical protein
VSQRKLVGKYLLARELSGKYLGRFSGQSSKILLWSCTEIVEVHLFINIYDVKVLKKKISEKKMIYKYVLGDCTKC